jgi:hypothetical protein
MTSCGFPPREIDEMTWRDVEDLTDYWRAHPPVHLLVAGYMGYQPPSTTPDDPAIAAALLRGGAF